MSVSAWSASVEGARRDRLEMLPLPWELSWPAEKQLLAATQFVRQVWREAHGGDSGAAAAALRAHVASRFEPLRLRTAAVQEGLLTAEHQHGARHGSAAWQRGVPPKLAACADAAPAAAATRAEVHGHVARGVGALADGLRNVSADLGVREIAAANYLELLGGFVVGTEHTHAFVRDCCLGGWAPPQQGGAGGSGWLEP